MFGFDKVGQTNTCQFLLPNAGNVYTQGIVVHIELIVPQEIDNVIAGTDFSGVSEQIIEYFYFVLVKSVLWSLCAIWLLSKCSAAPFHVRTSVCGKAYARFNSEAILASRIAVL